MLQVSESLYFNDFIDPLLTKIYELGIQNYYWFAVFFMS